ncbi:MAG: hypothetical protein HQK49_02715 [Oligoflexia bacterium]|nr:hypothetical protein [Oligoflexia bacterium]
MLHFKKFFILFIFILINISAEAKVDPPNYDFKFNMLYPFFPNKDFSEVKKTYTYEKDGLISLGVMNDGDPPSTTKIYKLYLKHKTFRFPIFFQVSSQSQSQSQSQEKIIDFFVSLPSYFLHDPFLQDLQKELGNQNKYSNYNGSALYIWDESKLDKNTKFIYSSTCTITCFPLYFSGTSKDPQLKPAKAPSLIDLMANKNKQYE